MSKIAGELNAEMTKRQDTYGDGNVYRGQRSKDSTTRTITSAEYQSWLESPLTKALKKSFEQSITDPENQPSQYGTVTLAMHESVIDKNQNLINALMESTKLSDNLYSKGHRLALELECLLNDTKDTAIQSKWWDSAHEALEDWRTGGLEKMVQNDQS